MTRDQTLTYRLQSWEKYAPFEVHVKIDISNHKVHIQYDILPLSPATVFLPEKTQATPEKMWLSTCMEVFEFDQDSPRYCEWNFNFWSQHNFYEFQDYRCPATTRTSIPVPLELICHQSPEKGGNLSLICTLPRHFQKSRFYPTAIIQQESASGPLYHYAVSHPQGAKRPDFHRPF